MTTHEAYGTEAGRLCALKGADFKSVFRYQFRAGDLELDLPGFTSTRFKGVCLQTGDALKVTPLKDCEGRLFGYVFGLAVHHNGSSAADAFQAGFNSASPSAPQEFEDILRHLSGRFGVIVAVSDEGPRFYADATGMIGAVYHRAGRAIAASLYLCLDRPLIPNPLYSQINSKGIYEDWVEQPAFDDTRDAEAKRLPAGHWLDLSTFTTQRFWPSATCPVEADPADYGRLIDEAISATEGVVSALTREGKCSLPLSGGTDSRAILAALSPRTQGALSQIFTMRTNRISRSDVLIARQLCALTGLNHETHIPGPEVSGDARASLDAGFEIASGGLRETPSSLLSQVEDQILEGAIVLRGQQIPVLKGVFLDKDPILSADADHLSKRILNLIGFAPDDPALFERFKAHASERLKDFPDAVRPRLADYAFSEAVNAGELAERFVGRWKHFYLSPFNSRRFIEIFASFAITYRIGMHAKFDFLFRANPKLAGVARVGEIKKLVKRGENEGNRPARLAHLRRTRERYSDLFGTKPPPIEIIPFSRL